MRKQYTFAKYSLILKRNRKKRKFPLVEIYLRDNKCCNNSDKKKKQQDKLIIKGTNLVILQVQKIDKT